VTDAPTAAGRRPTAGRAIASAATSTVLGSLPVFLLGGLAVLVRDELDFGELQLGFAVTVFFSTAALSAVPAGRFVARWGARTSTIAAAALSVVALLAMAATPSYAGLLAALVLAGAGNALAQIGSNETLARVVPARRQGLAFGVKQAAVPLATLLAGLALPVLGLTWGWRWGFALATLLALGCVALAPRRTAGGAPRARAARDGLSRPARNALLVVAVAATLGSAAANALGGFLVESAVSTGVPAGRAGLLLAGGSGLGVGVRLFAGWLADTREGGHLRAVGAMLAVGALGMVLLATGAHAALVPGTLLAFALGWSWPGLLTFAVVRLNPTAAASATGIQQTGNFAGGALGPLLFGLLVQTWSYRVAWSAAGVALVVAAALLAQAGRMFAGRPASDAPLAVG